MCSIQLWGTAKKSNTQKIIENPQTHNSNVPLYISNHTIHKDLYISKITETAELYYSKFRNRLQNHSKPLVKNLRFISILGNPPSEDKRQCPRHLISYTLK